MKKAAKLTAVLVTLVLIAGVFLVGNAFVGNPISKLLATHTAKTHLTQHYGDTDFQLDEVTYSFKTGGYYAHISSPSSGDSSFSLAITATGRLEWDSYEDRVVSKRNTMERLNAEYRAIVEAVFDAEQFPYDSHISYGDLRELHDVEVGGSEQIFGLDRTTLVLDQEYDVRGLGRQHGSLVFYAQDEEISPHRAAEILLDITNILAAENVPFYAISFVLEKPRNQDGVSSSDMASLHLTDFLCHDIYVEGLAARVQDAHEEAMAHFAALDAEKEMTS